MKKSIFLLLFSVLLPAAVIAETASAPALLTGVSLHGPMTWGKTNETRSEYARPLYGGEQYALPHTLLNKTKAAGFDFIRLTVDPGPFLALQGKELEGLYNRLSDLITQIQGHGLDVIVDIHPIGMVPAYNPQKLEKERFADYLAMLTRITKTVARNGTAHVAMEPMNEPQTGWGFGEDGKLQEMVEQMYKAVRNASPDITVILSGGRGGSADGLLRLDPTPFSKDSHVRYSFHYYLPYVFSHQGVRSQDPKNLKSFPMMFSYDLAYPADKFKRQEFTAAVIQRINDSPDIADERKGDIEKETENQLAEYFDHTGNREAITSDFRRVAEWAKRYGIAGSKIMLGEFNVTRKGKSWHGADEDSRARWLADVRSEAEQNGFSWAVWDLASTSSSLGMSLVSLGDAKSLDPVTLKALGKRQ